MHQHLVHAHRTSPGGDPAGGETVGVGLSIRWQDGPLRRDGHHHQPNGAFVETVIEAALGRLEFYQRGRFACDENVVAADHLRSALRVLDERTRSRIARGVEGSNVV